LGIHRMALSVPQDTMEARRHHLWYQISRGVNAVTKFCIKAC
jgi:hypothetical protein